MYKGYEINGGAVHLYNGKIIFGTHEISWIFANCQNDAEEFWIDKQLNWNFHKNEIVYFSLYSLREYDLKLINHKLLVHHP